MAKQIVKRATYPHPPELVWVALTDPHALAEWLMPNDFKPELGHKFRFQFDPMPMCGAGLTTCEVVEIDPPRRMVWTWQGHSSPGKRTPPPTRVEWTLKPTNEGTELTLVHTGLEGQPFLHNFMMNMGWGQMFKSLIPKVLAHVSPDGAFTPGAIPLEKRCYKAKTIPAELVR